MMADDGGCPCVFGPKAGDQATNKDTTDFFWSAPVKVPHEKHSSKQGYGSVRASTWRIHATGSTGGLALTAIRSQSETWQISRCTFSALAAHDIVKPRCQVPIFEGTSCNLPMSGTICEFGFQSLPQGSRWKSSWKNPVGNGNAWICLKSSQMAKSLHLS